MKNAGGTARIDAMLRSCVSCGLCLPHCATYLASGNEALSPRGRLQLLAGVCNGEISAGEPSVVRSFGLCLGCMACTAVCPSGVSFELLDYLRRMGVRGDRRRLLDPAALLDRRPVLELLRRCGGGVRRALANLCGPHWRQRLAQTPRPVSALARLIGVLPAAPGTDRELAILIGSLIGAGSPYAADTASAAATALAAGDAGDGAAYARARGWAGSGSGAGRPGAAPRVAWFAGCADSALLPATASRLRRLLDAHGCRVVDVEDQVCCGALASHAGRARRAKRLRRKNLTAFEGALACCDHVVVAAAGCGQQLRSYPATLADKLIDAVVLLDRILPAQLGSVPLRVAVHDPCHLRHGQGVVDAPRRLLRRIDGLRILEPAEADVCCGGAGAYQIRHPALARDMGRRKAEILAATGCDLIVTSDPGCLGQLADALAIVAPTIPIVPLSDLAWYAWTTGGSPDPSASPAGAATRPPAGT